MNKSVHNKDVQISLGQRESLALPIELEEGAPPLLFRVALITIASVTILLLLWASIARVQEISYAIGEITPSSPVREIAHLEGGIVSIKAVEVGDVVDIGTELVQLSRQSADDNFARFSARQAELQIRIERLRAQADDRLPDFSMFNKNWPTLVSEHRKIFSSAVDQFSSEIEALKSQEISTEAELRSAKVAQKEANEQLKLASEQFKIQNDLIEDGFTSKQALLEAKSVLSVSRSSLANATARHEEAKRARNALLIEKERKNAEYKNAVAEEKAKAVAELLELEQSLLISEDRDSRLSIRSPIVGIVNSLSVSGAGDLVRPGEVVAEIVPIDAKMIAEVRIPTKDIGHVKLQQNAEITITTFDKKQHGTLTGKISNISADSHIDERTGEKFYRAEIQLSPANQREEKLAKKVLPGMEISVRIITNSRSIVAYLLKPVARSVETAFSER